MDVPMVSRPTKPGVSLKDRQGHEKNNLFYFDIESVENSTLSDDTPACR
jgi:hypothetical protein